MDSRSCRVVLEVAPDVTLLDTIQEVVDGNPEIQLRVQSTFMTRNESGTDQSRDGLLEMFETLETLEVDLTAECMERLSVQIPKSLASTDDLPLRIAAGSAAINILKNNAIFTTDGDVSYFLDILCDHLTAAVAIEIDTPFRRTLLDHLLTNDILHDRVAQDSNIHRLSYGLYDADLSIRQKTIQLLSRLSIYNFASTQPILHELLLRLIQDLKFDGEVTPTAEIIATATAVLKTLMDSQPHSTESHLTTILKAVISRLEQYTALSSTRPTVKDPTSDAVTGLLLCLIELVHRMPNQYVRQNISRLAAILSKLIGTKNDRRKQTIAMRTIEAICEIAGGDALLHQLKPAELLACLTELKSTTPSHDAQIFTPLIQTLSKWDPAFVSLASSTEDVAESSERRPHAEFLSFPTDEDMIGDDDYYSSIAIHASLAVLEDARNTDYERTVKCLMDIFSRLQRSGVVYLQRVIPVLSKIVRHADDKLRLILFQHLSDLVRIAGGDVAPYCDALMHLCFQFWSTSGPLAVHILNLIAELANAVQNSFKCFLHELIPKLGEILSNQTESELIHPVLHLLQTSAPQLGSFLPVLFPILLRFLRKMPIYEESIPLDVQQAILKTLRHVLFSVQLQPTAKYLMASKLLLTFVEHLHRENSLKDDTTDTLVITMSVLGPKISRAFAQQIQSALGEDSEGMLQKGLSRLRDPEFQGDDIFEAEEMDALKASTFQSIDRPQSRTDVFTPNFEELQESWDSRETNTKEDWEEWMRLLSIEFLRQSSSPALRACYELAQIHPPVAKWLFTYSLLSVWSELDASLREQLQDILENVQIESGMSLEVIQPIVRLGEYLNFIETQEVALAPELAPLDALARKCNVYSTAMRYRTTGEF